MLFSNDIYLNKSNKLQMAGKQAIYDNIKKYGTVEDDECNK
jgi:hypothetical protein